VSEADVATLANPGESGFVDDIYFNHHESTAVALGGTNQEDKGRVNAMPIAARLAHARSAHHSISTRDELAARDLPERIQPATEDDSGPTTGLAIAVFLVPALAALLAAEAVSLQRELASWVVAIVLGLGASSTFLLFRSCKQFGGRLATAVLALVALANPSLGVALIFLIATW
jgi:hypothetical protein